MFQVKKSFIFLICSFSYIFGCGFSNNSDDENTEMKSLREEERYGTFESENSTKIRLLREIQGKVEKNRNSESTNFAIKLDNLINALILDSNRLAKVSIQTLQTLNSLFDASSTDDFEDLFKSAFDQLKASQQNKIVRFIKNNKIVTAGGSLLLLFILLGIMDAIYCVASGSSTGVCIGMNSNSSFNNTDPCFDDPYACGP